MPNPFWSIAAQVRILVINFITPPRLKMCTQKQTEAVNWETCMHTACNGRCSSTWFEINTSVTHATDLTSAWHMCSSLFIAADAVGREKTISKILSNERHTSEVLKMTGITNTHERLRKLRVLFIYWWAVSYPSELWSSWERPQHTDWGCVGAFAELSLGLPWADFLGLS